MSTSTSSCMQFNNFQHGTAHDFWMDVRTIDTGFYLNDVFYIASMHRDNVEMNLRMYSGSYLVRF